MKKLKLFFGVILIFCLTGCIKYNAIMDIKKDKSMDFSITYAMQKSMLEMSDDKTILSDEDKKNLESNGFSISDYSDDKMVGFIISKAIPNIDNVSSSDDVQYSLSNMMESNSNQSYMFKVEKGKDKNIYTANFIFDASDSELSDGDDATTEIQDGVTVEQSEVNIEGQENLDALGESLAESLDLKFVVKLPNGAISSNATSKSEDGKELTWNLSANKEDSITFQFSLSNPEVTTVGKSLTNAKSDIFSNLIYFVIGGIAVCVLVVIFVLIVVNNHNKKKVVSTVDDKSVGSSYEFSSLADSDFNEKKNIVVNDEKKVETANSVREDEKFMEEYVIEKEEPSVTMFDEKKEEQIEEVRDSSDIFSSVKDVGKDEGEHVIENEKPSVTMFDEKKEEQIEEVRDSSDIFSSVKDVDKGEEGHVIGNEKPSVTIFDEKKEEQDDDKPEEKKIVRSEIFPPIDDEKN